MNAVRTGVRFGILAAALALALLAAPAAQACTGYCDYPDGCGTCTSAPFETGMLCQQWGACACIELQCYASFETPESSSAPDPVFASEAAKMTSAVPVANQVGCSVPAPPASF